MDLSIICVNWNSLEYLRECVTSIYQYAHDLSFEIIVVDNASPEGGIESLELQFPAIRIVKSTENLGFARANNLGFKYSTGDYLLLLNPDTKLVGPAIEIMMQTIKQLPDAGIVGCKLLNSDFSVQTASIQKFPTIFNQLVNIELLRVRWPGCPIWDIGPLFVDSENPVKVEVIPGACMLMRRDVFARVGMLSEDYFMYAEDLDLNYKVRDLGLSNYYVGKAMIVHHGGRSSSLQRVSQWSTVMTCRAMQRYYEKHHGISYAMFYRVAMCTSALGRLLLLALMLPFGDKESIRATAQKWGTILKWSVGLGERIEA